MRMRRLLAVASCAVAVVALGAGSAFAGEITGNGKLTADRGLRPDAAATRERSIAPSQGRMHWQNRPPGRVVAGVQTCGRRILQIQGSPAAAIGLAPGDSCNGHTGFFSG